MVALADDEALAVGIDDDGRRRGTGVLEGADVRNVDAVGGEILMDALACTVPAGAAPQLDGAAETRLEASRVQVDCYATRYLDAHAVAEAVDNVLANLRRPELSAERDSLQDIWEDEAQLHRVSMDFSVWR